MTESGWIRREYGLTGGMNDATLNCERLNDKSINLIENEHFATRIQSRKEENHNDSKHTNLLLKINSPSKHTTSPIYRCKL